MVAAKNNAIAWVNYRIELTWDIEEGMALCAAATGNRETCEKQIYDERATIRITLASSPAGAMVTVDGIERGEAPKVVDLNPGSHDVQWRDGEQIKTFQIIVDSTKPTTWIWDVANDQVIPKQR